MKSLKRIWSYIRHASGDDAYERYCMHHSHNHPDSKPMNRAEYFSHRQNQKWSGITRCC